MNPLAHRIVIVLVAWLTLGAYGARAFACFLPCDCLSGGGCPTETVVAVSTNDDSATVPDAHSAESGSAKDDCDREKNGHHAGGAGKNCSCACHVGNAAAVMIDAQPRAPLRTSKTTLHPTGMASMTDAPRAGIEHPPRAV